MRRRLRPPARRRNRGWRGAGYRQVPRPPGRRSSGEASSMLTRFGRIGLMMNTRNFRYVTIGRAAVGANSWGAVAIGALAVGAFAVGALAIGRLAIGRLAVG